jgi:isoamylase
MRPELVTSRPGTNHPTDGRFSPVDEHEWCRLATPLGASFDGHDVVFAVFSGRATRVLLEVYTEAQGQDARHEYFMQRNPEDRIWRARLARVPEGTLYAFRCWGPNWDFDPGWQRGDSSAGFSLDVDAAGNRFNPNKVLFDPYARELSHDKESPELLAQGLDDTLYGTGGESYRGRPRREIDTGRWAPKGVVLHDVPYAGCRPRLPAEKAIIYEAHVRGLSGHPSASELGSLLGGWEGFEDVVGVPPELRGTYAGAAYVAKYLARVGFTTVELLPVHETQNDTNPDARPGGNFWGYMTFAYFAPDRRHAYDKSPGGPTREFRAMVEAFHREGMEVYVDVVYNHTGEGGNFSRKDGAGRWVKDPDATGFVSLGGLDAAEYYVRTSDGLLEEGATGCGNQLNFSSPTARALVLDSLTYWIEVMGVDGFRFDLAPVLGRLPGSRPPLDRQSRRQFFNDHPLLIAIRDLGLEHEVEMIAEAWDLWGYEVGNFPQDWGEWNGHYRDTVRRFVLGQGNAQELAEVMNGDFSRFADQGGSQRSINLVVAHDGFTLMDLVSYAGKLNGSLAWPFGPSDGGTDDNLSSDHGGDHALRRQQLRNLWTILLFSRGVPMVVWGDEFGRTQNGNNNPWNVDSVATWNNYWMIATHAPNRVPTGGGGAYHDNFGLATSAADKNPLFVFVRFVLGLRRRSAALKQRGYGDLELGSGDVTYLFRREDGERPLEAWNRAVWVRIDGRALGEGDFLLLLNLFDGDVAFRVPEMDPGRRWVRIIDTASWAEPQYNHWDASQAATIVDEYCVHAWSVVVLEEIAD